MVKNLNLLIEKYLKSLDALPGELGNLPLRTPREIAKIWSAHAHALTVLVPDPLIACRGHWTGLPPSTTNAASQLKDYFADSLVSAAARGIGARLERGLQFRLHVNHTRLRDFLTREIGLLRKESDEGHYEGPKLPDSGLLQHQVNVPPKLDPNTVEMLDRVEELISGEHSDHALELFLALWQYTYSHEDERDVTLGNQILRERTPDDKLKTVVYTITFGKEHFPTYTNFPAFQDSDRIEVVSLLSKEECEDRFQLALINRTRRRILCSVLSALDQISRRPALWNASVDLDTKNAPNEVIRHFGQRVLAALSEDRPGLPCYGVMTVLRKLHQQAFAQLKSGALWEKNVGQASPSKWLDGDQIKSEWIQLAQRFLLFHGGHGQHFYFIVSPPLDRTDIRSTISVGTNRPLSADELDGLLNICERSCETLNRTLNKQEKVEYHTHFTCMPAIIGKRTTTRLNERMLGIIKRLGVDGRDRQKAWSNPEDAFYDPTIGGLPHYIVFAEAMATQASHEGKKLEFSILVADGVARYQHVETLSSLHNINQDDEGDGEVDSWVTYESSKRSVGKEKEEERPAANAGLVARILGNYAFLQHEGTVLLGNRSGQLLALARTLLGSASPEELTQSLDSLDELHDHRGCYLVRVLKSGELQVFHRGELILSRRMGRYRVVDHDGFGAAYRQKLVDELGAFTASVEPDSAFLGAQPLGDFETLVRVIWRISQTRGEGGCFVLGSFDPKDVDDKLYARALRLGHVLPHAEGLPIVWGAQEEVLEDLATQDGATIINLCTGLAYGRRLLRSDIRSDSMLNDEMHLELCAENPEMFHWGTRHLSSLELARDLHEHEINALIVTVSSDGDIHVFRHGIVDNNLTYPQRVRAQETPSISPTPNQVQRDAPLTRLPSEEERGATDM